MTYYKIISRFVIQIENMNLGLTVAWKYQTRLVEFDMCMRPSTQVNICDMNHNTDDMNFLMNL